MENFNNLITLGQKQDRGTLTAAEWNSLVNTIINSANSCPSANKTFTIKRKYGTSWVDASTTSTSTGIQITAGEEYQISGYLEGDITINSQSDPSEKTVVHLHNVLIVGTGGTCVNYVPSKKSLVVEIDANTENYLYQTGTSSDFESLGCIRSANNLTVKGEGYLLLQNASGHGIKSNELTIYGRPHIMIEATHDGIHGDNVINIEEGDFYFKSVGHDAVGSSARGSDDSGKLRGIVRVFGGNFYVESMPGGNVFDASYDYMGVVDDGNSVTYYTPDEVTTANPALSLTYTLTSKIFSPFVSIQGPALTPTNICSNHMAAYSVDTTAATVTLTPSGGTASTVSADANGVYIIPSGNNEATITITGYFTGLLVVNSTKCELCLDRATLVPLGETTWATITGNGNSYSDAYNSLDHNTVVYYALTSSNLTIQTNGDTEASYIVGQIMSKNNLKITPKGGSYLYLTNPGKTPLYAGTITIYNGGGNMYSYCSAKGLDGNEIIIGSETGKDYASDKNLKGNLYFLHNTEYDLYARVSGKNKKATIDITTETEGVIVTETLGAAKTFLIEDGGSTVADTGIIRDGINASTTTFVGNLQSLKYTKLAPTTTLYGGEKYGKTINGELAKYFN